MTATLVVERTCVACHLMLKAKLAASAVLQSAVSLQRDHNLHCHLHCFGVVVKEAAPFPLSIASSRKPCHAPNTLSFARLEISLHCCVFGERSHISYSHAPTAVCSKHSAVVQASDINALFGFRLECTERLGEQDGIWAWKRLNSLFNWLPLAATIEDRVLCMHGGEQHPSCHCAGTFFILLKQLPVLLWCWTVSFAVSRDLFFLPCYEAASACTLAAFPAAMKKLDCKKVVIYNVIAVL